MELHVKVLGAVYIVLGVLGLLGTLVAILVFGSIFGAAALGGASPDDPALPFIAIIGLVVLATALVLSVPAVVIGWGLLTLRRWAWLAGIVLSCIMLLNFPFGTLVAIYGLIVLVSDETGPLFGRPARRMPAV